MITLTNPIQVPNSLGGTTHSSYDKLRVVSITADPFSLTISAQVQIMVSTDANQPIISGSLTVTATGANPIVILQVPTLNFYRAVAITGASVTTAQGWITSLQNNVETGLVNIGAIAGTQAAGV